MEHGTVTIFLKQLLYKKTASFTEFQTNLKVTQKLVMTSVVGYYRIFIIITIKDISLHLLISLDRNNDN